MSSRPRVGPEPPTSSKSSHDDRREKRSSKKRKRSYSSSSSDSSSSDSSSSYSSSSSSSSDRRHRKSKHKRDKSRRHKRKSRLPAGTSKLSMEDYFRYAPEYRDWLSSTKGIYTSSLSTDDAKAMFSLFVKAWNKGKLASKYYDGIEPTSVLSSSRSTHQWVFKNVDDRQMDLIRNEVNAATSAGKSRVVSTQMSKQDSDDLFEPYAAFGPSNPTSNDKKSSSSSNHSSHSRRSDEIYEKEIEYEKYKKEQRDFRRRERENLEEQMPKATGRDRIYEKRREENDRRKYQQQEQSDPSVSIDPFDDSRSIREYAKAQEMAANQKRQQREEVISEKAMQAKAKEERLLSELRELARNSGHKV